MESQPSHLLSSELVQREASRAQRRLTLLFAFQSSSALLTACVRSAGNLYDRLAAADGAVLRTLFSTAARSLSKASAKSLTPSSVSWSVTAFMEIPARARSLMV